MPTEKTNHRSAERFLPLHQTVFFILMALVDGPKHGYAVAKFVEERSEGTIRIAIGNLYVSLKRLLDDGLIERVPGESDDDRRKTYRISGLGAQVIDLERHRIEMLARAAAGLRGVPQGA